MLSLQLIAIPAVAIAIYLQKALEGTDASIDAQLDMAVQQGIQQVLQLVQLSQMQPIRYQSPAHWNEWVDGENAVNVEAEISSITTGW